MNDIRIAYMDDSNNCRIVAPTQEALDQIGLEEVIARSIPVGTDYIITSKQELPQSRVNRNTWIISNNMVVEQ